jgi:hypothetical protein
MHRQVNSQLDRDVEIEDVIGETVDDRDRSKTAKRGMNGGICCVWTQREDASRGLALGI